MSIPYVVYWLVMKDFLYNLDSCDNNSNETGYCLSNLQCSDVLQGINIGACGSEDSGSVCCKITLNFFNETYLLKPLIARKSQNEMKMMLFSADKHNRFKIQYGNKSISSERSNFYRNEVNVCTAPDSIMWPIMVSLSGESSKLKKHPSVVNQLYVVSLDKLDSGGSSNKRGLDSTCPSDDNEYRLLIQPLETLRSINLFSPEMQKLNKMNLTVFDSKSLFDDLIKPEKRNRRSFFHDLNKKENLDFEDHEKEVFDNVSQEEIVDKVSGQSEAIGSTNNPIENSCKNNVKEDKNISLIRNHLIGSKSTQFITVKSIGDQDNYDRNETRTSDKLNHELSFRDLSTEKAYDLQEKETDRLLSSTSDAFPIKGSSVSNNPLGHVQDYVDNGVKFRENENTRDLRKPEKDEATHHIRKPLQVQATHDMRKPVQKDSTHDMRKSVKLEITRDLRTPVQIEATHDLSNPIQKGDTHDMQRPVQIHSNHNLRKPVMTTRESDHKGDTHDMRTPVVLDESHDLRWPVLEEETDLHIVKENGIFQNIHHEGNVSDSISAYGRVDVAEHKLDDEKIINKDVRNLSVDCKTNFSFSNKNINLQSLSENENKQKQEKSSDLWKEATTACGKYSGDMPETGSNKIKGKWPWMVSLREKKAGKHMHKCSASLLNSLWVVTVAHCVDMKPKSAFMLLLGNQDSENEHDKDSYTETTIDEIVIHPKFNRGMFENDLALLRMTVRVPFRHDISPICLPWSTAEPTLHDPSLFFGWELKYQQISDDMQKLAMPVMTHYECETLFSTGKNKENFKDMFLCAGISNGNCDSESGGPLTSLNSDGRWSLIGLVSWGGMCPNPEQAGVYIRISSYAQWIKDVIDCYEISL